MREKLATLPLTQLKELAKSQGIKNISGLRIVKIEKVQQCRHRGQL